MRGADIRALRERRDLRRRRPLSDDSPPTPAVIESDSDQMSERAQAKSRANPLLRLLERREKLIFPIKQTAALGKKSKKADRRGQRDVIDRLWG